jgi:cation:H+ antiporter
MLPLAKKRIRKTRRGNTRKRAKRTVGKDKGPKPQKSVASSILSCRNLMIALVTFFVLLALASVQDIFNIGHLGFYILTMVIAIVLLIAASERFLIDVKGLARRAGIAEIIIGLTIVSIGTSLPEIASTSMASYQAKMTGNAGLSDFAIGNIYGSVLVQITFILGLVVLVKPMIINRGSVKRDGLAMIGAVCLLSFFTMRDLRLDQLESLVLVIIYGLFLYYLVKNRHAIKKEELADGLMEECDEGGGGGGEEQAEKDKGKEKEATEDEPLLPAAVHCLMLIVALALVIYSSNWLVLSAVEVASGLGVPEGIIGLTVSAVGTSLPELAIALVAVSRSKGVAIGTLIGSNVTDPLLSIGVAGMIHPISVSAATSSLFVTVIAPFTIVSCIIGVAFMWTGMKIERWEGAALMAAYIIFVPLVIFLM